MVHIKTVPREKADKDLAEVYEEILKTRGKIAQVHKVQSLNPEALKTHMDFYLAVMFGKSPLKRYQREMMAVVVSAANACDYCIQHHKEALLAYWKDEPRIEMLLSDPGQADLDETDLLLVELSEKLTKYPADDYSGLVNQLKKNGMTDRAILDAVQVIAYFNFVNRLVLGLGVQFDENEVKGYNY